jgi:TPR repeat protein
MISRDCAVAQKQLGDCYFRGRGVDRDQARALRHYQAAIEQGHCGARAALVALLPLRNRGLFIGTSVHTAGILASSHERVAGLDRRINESCFTTYIL